ncbi:T9SS type A sorting domain-containing protein, partial [Winogradskyella ouciana]|uniref:T9SS type A sorting domain-containing protein n=1 Tax=Winogradskyella ouciana TaxID=2608631 RepID=UPI001F27840F
NIYPNPARDVISVDFESESADKLLPKEILLYNEKSAIVRAVSGSNSFSASTKRTQMDVASLPRGTYYLYMVPEKDSGQKTEVKRILL